MSRVFMISDLHLGHSGILKWARNYREGANVDEMNQWLMDQWNSVVKKRDIVWVLGDVAWNEESLQLMYGMNGQLRLILGNHDTLPPESYSRVFDKVVAYQSYKGFWLSHMPIHEHDMLNTRVKGNIHGHLHQGKIDDPRYVNVSVEHSKGVPRLFSEILEEFTEANRGKTYGKATRTFTS